MWQQYKISDLDDFLSCWITAIRSLTDFFSLFVFFTSFKTNNVHIHYYIAKQNLLFPNDLSLKQAFLNEFNSISFNSTSKLSTSKLHSQQTIILLQITSTPRPMQQFFFRRFSKPSIVITNHHSLIRSLRDVHKRDLVRVLRQSIRHFLYSSSHFYFQSILSPNGIPFRSIRASFSRFCRFTIASTSFITFRSSSPSFKNTNFGRCVGTLPAFRWSS